MTTAHAGVLLDYLRRVTAPLPTRPADAELLRRFVAQRDQASFTALLRRHGPMVLRVCQRVLHNRHDAEDAFQATFLALLQKAATISCDGSVAGWLHRVAYHTALNALAAADRRSRLQRQAPARTTGDPLAEISGRELLAVLDEELARLPERCRAVIVLCYLEGHTRDEAARLLGCPLGTLKSRLEQARRQLRHRLARRGLELSAALLAVGVAEQATATVMPTALLAEAIAAAVPGRVAALAGTGARTVAATKGRTVLAIVLGFVTLVGTGLAARHGMTTEQAGEEPVVAAAESSKEEPTETTRTDHYGDPLPTDAIARLGTVRLRHGNQVGSVVFAPDGRTVIAGDMSGWVYFWDTATGKALRRLRTHPLMVSSAFLMPGGKTLISAGGEVEREHNSHVRLVDLSTGKPIREAVADGRFWSASVALSPDGKTVAMNGGFNLINLWDPAKGQRRELRCDGDADYAANVTFAPDGKTLASVGGKLIRFWDVSTGKLAREQPVAAGQVHFLAHSPDGSLLAVAYDTEVHLLEPATGKEVRRFTGLPHRVDALAFAPDGRVMLSAGASLDLWDLQTGKAVWSLPVERGDRIWSVAFAPDGKTIAAGCQSSLIRLFETATGRELLPFDSHRNWLGFVAFTDGGKQVVSAADDHTVRLWDPSTGRELHQFCAEGAFRFSDALSPDGRLLATGTGDGTPLYDVTTGKEVRRLKLHPRWSDHLTFSPAANILATTVRYDSRVMLWDLSTGEVIREIQTPHRNGPVSLAFSPDGRTLASGGEYDGRICLWETATAQELRQWVAHGNNSELSEKQRVSLLQFSPDGRTLVSMGSDGATRLWDPATGDPRGKLDIVGPVAFSPDGRTLATDGPGATVCLWELATLHERRRFEGHRGAAFRLAFSPDGGRLASAAMDTTVLIWDVRGTRDAVRAETFSSEGHAALWDHLASDDATRAYRAMTTLCTDPAAALALLEGQLRPAGTANTGVTEPLLADLDSERFEVRKKALAELQKLGDAVRPALRKNLDSKPSAEVRRQLERLLAELGGPPSTPDQVRLVRAVEVLEWLGTAGARKQLELLAKGETEARLTREAKAALLRLEKHPTHMP